MSLAASIVSTELGIVFLAALATAFATGLGAVPFVFARRASAAWLAVTNAAAAGFMLAAAFLLFGEGASEGIWRTLLGAAAGIGFIALLRTALAAHEYAHAGALRGADARTAIVVVAVMAAHSFSEGVGIGVSYGDGQALGVLISIALAIHNIPEGLAISLTMVPRGTRVRTAATWSIISSLPQPLMAVPAFVFVEMFDPILPAGLGFAAGAMAWLVASELVPAAWGRARLGALAASFVLSFVAMMALQIVLVLA